MWVDSMLDFFFLLSFVKHFMHKYSTLFNWSFSFHCRLPAFRWLSMVALFILHRHTFGVCVLFFFLCLDERRKFVFGKFTHRHAHKCTGATRIHFYCMYRSMVYLFYHFQFFVCITYFCPMRKMNIMNGLTIRSVGTRILRVRNTLDDCVQTNGKTFYVFYGAQNTMPLRLLFCDLCACFFMNERTNAKYPAQYLHKA